MSPIPRRFLQASAVVLTMLLAAEGLLQAGALVVRAGTRVVPKSWITGSTRVLALGDSNTFGIYLEPEEAYPAQLERLWNQAYPEHPIEVLNLGYPGTNSFRILDNIDAMMRKLRPDVVLLTVGVNDFLTPVEEIAAADALFTRLRRAVTRHSRLHRFVHLLRRNQEGPVEVGIERRKWEWTDDPQASLSQVHRFQAANAGRGAEQVFRVGGEEFVASKGGEAAARRFTWRRTSAGSPRSWRATPRGCTC